MKFKRFGDTILAICDIIVAIDRIDSAIRGRRRKPKRRYVKYNYDPDLDRLVFKDKDSAIRFMDKVRRILSDKGVISAADLFIMNGLRCTPEDHRILWYKLPQNKVKIKKVARRRYRVILPAPVISNI